MNNWVSRLIPLFLCTTTLSSCSSQTQTNLIDLRPVLKTDKDFGLGSTGNFLKMESGKIFFFAPSTREIFARILAGETAANTGKFLCYSDGQQTLETLNIAKSKENTLKIGNEIADSKELDRVRVTPEWASVEKYLTTNFRMPLDPRQKLSLCSILRLKNGLFLISGGFLNDTDKDVASTAIVFDAKLGRSVKTLKLQIPRRMHESVELSNGKIVIFGGFDKHAPIEVLYIDSNQSDLLSPDLLPVKSGFTYILDSKDRCLILGGKGSKDALPSVSRIDFEKKTVESLPNLSVARGYYEPTTILAIPQNIVRLSSGAFLISGGHAGMQNEVWGPRWLKNAEIININDDTGN